MVSNQTQLHFATTSASSATGAASVPQNWFQSENRNHPFLPWLGPTWWRSTESLDPNLKTRQGAREKPVQTRNWMQIETKVAWSFGRSDWLQSEALPESIPKSCGMFFFGGNAHACSHCSLQRIYPEYSTSNSASSTQFSWRGERTSWSDAPKNGWESEYDSQGPVPSPGPLSACLLHSNTHSLTHSHNLLHFFADNFRCHPVVSVSRSILFVQAGQSKRQEGQAQICPLFKLHKFSTTTSSVCDARLVSHSSIHSLPTSLCESSWITKHSRTKGRKKEQNFLNHWSVKEAKRKGILYWTTMIVIDDCVFVFGSRQRQTNKQKISTLKAKKNLVQINYKVFRWAKICRSRMQTHPKLNLISQRKLCLLISGSCGVCFSKKRASKNSNKIQNHSRIQFGPRMIYDGILPDTTVS